MLKKILIFLLFINIIKTVFSGIISYNNKYDDPIIKKSLDDHFVDDPICHRIGGCDYQKKKLNQLIILNMMIQLKKNHLMIILLMIQFVLDLCIIKKKINDPICVGINGCDYQKKKINDPFCVGINGCDYQKNLWDLW